MNELLVGHKNDFYFHCNDLFEKMMLDLFVHLEQLLICYSMPVNRKTK